MVYSCLRINKDSTGVKQLGDGITKECIIYCEEIIYSVSVQYFLIKGLAAPTGLDGRDSVDAVQEPILLCGVELLNPRVLSGAVWILFNYTLFPASAGSFLPTIYCFSIVNLWLVLFHAKRAMEDDRVRMAVENRNSRAQAEFINNEDDDDPLGELPPVRGRIGGPTRRSSKGGWTPEEDETLRRAVQCFKGKHWKKIAEFFPDRTDVQCLHRWQKVLNPELIKGPWTKEEDESIVELVNRHGAKKSSSIVKNLPGHIGKQCCERRMGYGRTDLLEMDMASHQMFSTFMAKATQFEELGKLGGELLARFHQELGFLIHFWKTLWKLLGFQLRFSTSFHPQTNGQNYSLVHALCILSSESAVGHFYSCIAAYLVFMPRGVHTVTYGEWWRDVMSECVPFYCPALKKTKK